MGRKSLKGHPFIMFSKNGQFFDNQTAIPPKWIIDILFKNNRIRKHMTNFKTTAGPSPSTLFRVHVTYGWSLICILDTVFCKKSSCVPQYLVQLLLNKWVQITFLQKASLNFKKCKKPDLWKEEIFCIVCAHFFKMKRHY